MLPSTSSSVRPAPPDHRRAPAERLLDTLEQAGVVLGRYDARPPRHLADNHGHRSVRAVAGWIGRVGRCPAATR